MPPTIEQSYEVDKPKVVENKPLTLTCNATGIPPPVISWLKNNTLISGNTSHYQLHNDNSQLYITSAQVEDATRFTCTVTNTAGTTEKHFDVDVLGKKEDLF